MCCQSGRGAFRCRTFPYIGWTHPNRVCLEPSTLGRAVWQVVVPHSRCQAVNPSYGDVLLLGTWRFSVPYLPLHWVDPSQPSLLGTIHFGSSRAVWQVVVPHSRCQAVNPSYGDVLLLGTWRF